MGESSVTSLVLSNSRNALRAIYHAADLRPASTLNLRAFVTALAKDSWSRYFSATLRISGPGTPAITGDHSVEDQSVRKRLRFFLWL
jgi:hypothetical protein